MPAQYQDPYSTTYAAPLPTMGATKTGGYDASYEQRLRNAQAAAGMPAPVMGIPGQSGPFLPTATQAGQYSQGSMPPVSIYGISGTAGAYGNTGPMLPSNVNASNLYASAGGYGMSQPYMPAAANIYSGAYNQALRNMYSNPSYTDMGSGYMWQNLPQQYYGGQFQQQNPQVTQGGAYDARIWAPGMPWSTMQQGYGGNYTQMPWAPDQNSINNLLTLMGLLNGQGVPQGGLPAAQPTPSQAAAPQSVNPANKATAGPSGAAYYNVYQDPNAPAMNQEVNRARREQGVAPYLGYDPLGIPFIQSTNLSTPPPGWGGSTGVLTNLTRNAPTPAALPRPAGNAPASPAPTTPAANTSGLGALTQPRRTAAGVTPTATVSNQSAQNNGPVGLASQRRLF